MHDRHRLGMAPAELLVRHLPTGLPNNLERELVHHHRQPLRVLANLTVQQLVDPLPRLLAERVVRTIVSMPLDGHDAPRANAEGAELARARDEGGLTPVVLPQD